MDVGSDLDGVGANFGDSVYKSLEYFGLEGLWKSGPTDKPFWHFYREWGWTDKQWVDFCNTAADAGILFTGEPRPNFVEAMKEIKANGHRLIFITDRPFGSFPWVSKNITYQWFEANEIPYDVIAFSSDKTCIKTDIFVEDKIENYDALVQHNTPCCLINRPWNEVKGGDSRYRIDDISEYPAIVEAVADEQARYPESMLYL